MIYLVDRTKKEKWRLDCPSNSTKTQNWDMTLKEMRRESLVIGEAKMTAKPVPYFTTMLQYLRREGRKPAE